MIAWGLMHYDIGMYIARRPWGCWKLLKVIYGVDLYDYSQFVLIVLFVLTLPFASPSDVSNETDGKNGAEFGRNTVLVSTSVLGPLLHPNRAWVVAGEYHRQLRGSWEGRSLLFLAEQSDDFSSARMYAGSLGLARYFDQKRQGLHVGGLMALLYADTSYKLEDWGPRHEFGQALWGLIGYKHVFRQGVCVNVALSAWITRGRITRFDHNPDRVGDVYTGRFLVDLWGVGYTF